MVFPATNPRVSVILTAFHRTAFLRDAIESALAQTFAAREIIVSDDSANAEIRSICEAYPLGAVRYRSNASPLGAARNVQAAVAEARGVFIAILNDDDVWEPEFLATLAPPLEKNTRLVLAFGDHWIMREDGMIDAPRSDANSAEYRRDKLQSGDVTATGPLVIENNSVPLAMAALFRKDAVDWDKLSLPVGGAYDFWISCLLAATGRPFHFINRRLSRYRLHESMETARQSPGKNDSMAFIFQTLLDTRQLSEIEPLLRKKYAGALFACGRQRLRFHQIKPARDFFRRSFRARFDFKTLVALCCTALPKKLRERLGLSNGATPCGLAR